MDNSVENIHADVGVKRVKDCIVIPNNQVPVVFQIQVRFFFTPPPIPFLDLGPVSRKSRKLFGPEKPFQKLRSAYSKRLVFYYDFKIREGKFIAKFHVWKRLDYRSGRPVTWLKTTY